MKFNYQCPNREIEIDGKVYPLAKRTIPLLEELSEIENQDSAVKEINELHDKYDVIKVMLGEQPCSAVLGAFDQCDIDMLQQLFVAIMSPFSDAGASNESAD